MGLVVCGGGTLLPPVWLSFSAFLQGQTAAQHTAGKTGCLGTSHVQSCDGCYASSALQGAGRLCFLTDLGSLASTPPRYPCLEDPLDGGAWWAKQSIGSQGVRHEWSDWALTQHQAGVHPLAFQTFLERSITSVHFSVGLIRNHTSIGSVQTGFCLVAVCSDATVLAENRQNLTLW